MKRLHLGLLIALVLVLAFGGITMANNIPTTGVSIVVVDSPRDPGESTGRSPGHKGIIMLPGEKIELKAEVVPSNASDKRVTWDSTNKKVATVKASSNAIVTVVGEGTTIIIVTTRDGSFIDRLTVVVPPTDDDDRPAVTDLILSSNRIDNVRIGDTITLIADVYPAGARTTNIKWRTNDDTVGRITNASFIDTARTTQSKAIIRAERLGTVEITVYVDDNGDTPISDTCTIVVTDGAAVMPTGVPTPSTGGAALYYRLLVLAVVLAGAGIAVSGRGKKLFSNR